MEAGLVGVSKHILRKFLHEDITKTPVAAPEEGFALEFDHMLRTTDDARGMMI